MHSPRWLSHFSDAARQAERYRIGRVLLAGDAAHIHAPAGGQGMNLGMQDAFNLGWKLAAVLRGEATGELLDSYHDERHVVGADTLKLIRAQTALFGLGEPIAELYAVLSHLIGFDDVNTYLSATLSGLEIRYPSACEHPLLGRRVPDIEISIGGRTTTIYELLHPARPVLLDFSADIALSDAATEWTGRITTVTATNTTDPWTLPGATVPPPWALLVRPDGYVAWISDGELELPALRETLTAWCGAVDKVVASHRRRDPAH